MYSLVSAIGRNKDLGGRWETIDTSTLTIYQLYQKYSAILLTVTNPFFPNKMGLDLYQLYSALNGSQDTIAQWLVKNANKTLPTVDKVFEIKQRHARYKDGFQANYTIIPAKPGASFDADLPRADKTSLFMKRERTSMAKFVKYCLVSVNGFFHYLDGGESGAWVEDGMKSCVMSRRNQLGILDFEDIGALDYIKITDAMITRHFDAEGLGNRAVINVGQDISNKTIALVLGGYLHILDKDTFYRVGDKEVMIDFNFIPMLERYYESKEFIDLTSLPLQKSTVNENQIGINNFFSDEVIRAYLKLPQTFLVIIDNPYIYLERESADNTEFSGQVISYRAPDLPLISQYGRVLDYWNCGNEMGQWALNVIDHGVNNYKFNTVNPKKLESVSRERTVGGLRKFGHVQFLKIATDV